MLEAKLRNFRITFAFQAVLAFATVAGFGLALVPDRKWIAIFMGILILIAQIALYKTTGNTRVLRFKNEASHKFINFFTQWYQRQGEHTIFCKDLDWLDGIPAAQITESVRQQGGHATLIISNDNAKACSAIRSGGSRIVVVPAEVPMKDIKMSLHVGTNGFKEIIVQKKPKKAQAVKFIRTTDSIMIALAETVIAACTQIENK